jgi:hypothetical protein
MPETALEERLDMRGVVIAEDAALVPCKGGRKKPLEGAWSRDLYLGVTVTPIRLQCSSYRAGFVLDPV